MSRGLGNRKGGIHIRVYFGCKAACEANQSPLTLKFSIFPHTKRPSCCAQQEFIPPLRCVVFGSCPFQHRLDGLSRMRVLDRLLEVLEVVVLDKFFHGKLALGVGLDQKRDKLLVLEAFPTNDNHCTSARTHLRR